jgi:hypothetical protein
MWPDVPTAGVREQALADRVIVTGHRQADDKDRNGYITYHG